MKAVSNNRFILLDDPGQQETNKANDSKMIDEKVPETQLNEDAMMSQLGALPHPHTLGYLWILLKISPFQPGIYEVPLTETLNTTFVTLLSLTSHPSFVSVRHMSSSTEWNAFGRLWDISLFFFRRQAAILGACGFFPIPLTLRSPWLSP